MMVFPLIPPDVKQDLPNLPTIQFVHPHNLGKFNFTIQKSPSGFNVTVRPMLGSAMRKLHADADAAATASDADTRPCERSIRSIFDRIESSSVGHQVNVSGSDQTYRSSQICIVDGSRVDAEDRRSTRARLIEVVSANDPEFQTVFSDTSAYEPPGRWQDFEVAVRYVFAQRVEIQPMQETNLRPHRPQLQCHTTVPPDVVLPPIDRRRTDRRKKNLMMTARMDALFNRMAEIGASDLHLSVSMPPMVRKDGKMQRLECSETTLTPEVRWTSCCTR